jgi:hypothetical protein
MRALPACRALAPRLPWGPSPRAPLFAPRPRPHSDLTAADLDKNGSLDPEETVHVVAALHTAKNVEKGMGGIIALLCLAMIGLIAAIIGGNVAVTVAYKDAYVQGGGLQTSGDGTIIRARRAAIAPRARGRVDQRELARCCEMGSPAPRSGQKR